MDKRESDKRGCTVAIYHNPLQNRLKSTELVSLKKVANAFKATIASTASNASVKST